jgi:glycosyltransferase involved in cell wall biosynthesis
LSQTYANIEVIIVDNASTDSTKDVVHSYQSEKIRYIYTDIKGRSNARNLGLQEARGEWIQFLDADDLLDQFYVETAVKALKENPGCQAVQCSTEYIKDEKVMNVLAPYSKEDMYDNLLVGNTIPINSLMLRKDICGRFPEGMEYCEDWVFWIESLADKNICFNESYKGAKVIIHENNTMTAIQKMKFYELEVLLRYKHIKIDFKKNALRNLKIVKRYVEYVLFTKEENDTINAEARKYMYLKAAKKLSGIPFIRDYVKKKIGETNEQNAYK